MFTHQHAGLKCQCSVQAEASTSTASDTSKAILHILRRKTVHKVGYHVPVLDAEARSTALYVVLYSRKLTKPLTLNNNKEKHAGSLNSFLDLSYPCLLSFCIHSEMSAAGTQAVNAYSAKCRLLNSDPTHCCSKVTRRTMQQQLEHMHTVKHRSHFSFVSGNFLSLLGCTGQQICCSIFLQLNVTDPAQRPIATSLVRVN